ncbi:MAG: ribosome biogenesis GTPase YlqF [Pseudomonadales bacterium]|nr:ribosome biogenesis GTPase YlqF [Pseudomonadales bacterium]
MAIHWYPGHMHKANKAMTAALPDVDLVIELLDARLPFSSQNPAIEKLTKNKPCIKILSKADLADPQITHQWQTYFEQQASVKTLLTTLEQTDKAQKVTQLCRKLVPAKFSANINMLAMITGIPNVGKSTLINAMAGRKIAKTGNEPAITKGLQRIKLDSGIILLDTPGILWPKIHNENSGYRLAASGAIKDTAMSLEEVAFYLADYLLQHYPEQLRQRFQIDALPDTELELLECLGARRGCLRAGGQVELEKISVILINELRSGKLGRISLEVPAMIEVEQEIVKQQQAEKAERDQRRKKKKHNRGNPSGART